MKLSRIIFSSLLLTMLLNESFGMTPGQQRAMKIVIGYKTKGKVPDSALRRAVESIAGIHDDKSKAMLAPANLQSYLDAFNLGDKPEEIARKITEKVKADLANK